MAPGKTRNSQWHLSADPSVFLGADRSWSFSLGASYNSRNKKPLFTTRSNFDINLGATKRFPFGGTVSLNIYNILDHTPFEGFFNSPSYSLYSKNLSHSRLIELRFEMSFGKQFRLRVSPQ